MTTASTPQHDGPASQRLTQDRVDAIRSAIERAITRLGQVEILRPSAFWAFCLDHMAYVRNLPAVDLDDIRHHTFHITGDIYQYYLFTPPADIATRLRNQFDLTTLHASSQLRVDEPEGGIGHRLDGRLVSVDSQRYQNVVSEIDRAGLLVRPPRRILEIGSGYGGLARAISRCVPGVQYWMVDLPQTLFFAAIFLSRFVDPAAVTVALDRPDLDAMTPFVLVPTHLAPALASQRFDLAINQSSMQEMTPAQIDFYLDVINTTTPRFYSRNKVHRTHLLERTSQADANERIASQMAELAWSLPEPPPPSVFRKQVDRLRRAIRGGKPRTGSDERPLVYRTRFAGPST